MTKVAIISGSGRLPLLIGENLIKKKYDVFFICLKNNANSSDYKKYKYCLSSITSFTQILNILKKQKISSIIMAGSINRPSVKDIKFDLNTLKLIKNYYLESKGDDQLLKTISSFSGLIPTLLASSFIKDIGSFESIISNSIKLNRDKLLLRVKGN